MAGHDKPPALGLVGRFAEAPDAWSGIPAGLARGFAALGRDTFWLSAEPTRGSQDAVRRWLALTRRVDESWLQTPEMMLLRTAAVHVRLLRVPQRSSVSWVQMGSEFGRVRGARLVTLDDMTVSAATRLTDFDGGPLRPEIARAWIRRQGAIYRHATACCVASRWQAASLIRDYGVPLHKVHVVGFGWNNDVPAVVRDWSTPRFLFVGLGWRRKNGDAVVRAFGRIRQEFPDAQLDVVGDHPRLDEPGVTGHGVLGLADPSTRQTLVALFRRATCFVLPSLYEPFGIVYVEAGRAGLPSIATSVGGAHDAVGPGGGEFVAPRSDVDLFEAMRTMANGATAAAAGACAARYSARLSWSLVAGRVAGALGEALPGGPVDDLVELDANWASSLSNEHHQ